MDNVLIIAPHPDDEVLGCFSFLEGAKVAYITTRHPRYPEGENIKEQQRLVNIMALTTVISPKLANLVNMLDENSIFPLIDHIEGVINKLKPHTVLVPNSSYNQDHRVLYDAALTASRHHDTNYFVKRILLYEQPETWDTMRKPIPFQANYYRPIDIEDKLGAISIYLSQIRWHRSPEYIKAIAKVRGQQANVDYAEAFEVVRWIE